MVEYREGKENRAADALSRREEDGETKEGELMAVCSPTTTWVDTVRQEYADNSDLQGLRQQFEKGELDLSLYTSHDGLLFYKGSIYLASSSPLRHTVLQQLHEKAQQGAILDTIKLCNE